MTVMPRALENQVHSLILIVYVQRPFHADLINLSTNVQRNTNVSQMMGYAFQDGFQHVNIMMIVLTEGCVISWFENARYLQTAK